MHHTTQFGFVSVALLELKLAIFETTEGYVLQIWTNIPYRVGRGEGATDVAVETRVHPQCDQ